MVTRLLCVYPFRYLQVLIQEMGVNVDMSFLMAMLGLLAQLPSTTTEVSVCFSCSISQ